ncbi:MAG TPA: FliM/FliN family flagellar motor switch protein [Candidatus Polarisedimenticolia bacterium]|nr:FliM/FliN family flagellar motor switch protein [Candidatus Polarisedimenticolia bacterium]
MSKLLTKQELEALLEGGPIVHAPTERIQVGDAVEILVEGVTLAYGRFVHENGRLCVRVTQLRTR